MSVRNQDLDLDKFFVHVDTGTIARQSQLAKQPLNKEIYFRPSHSPLITVHDTEQGTCYQHWKIPSASIYLTGHEQNLPSSLSLVQYQHLLYNKIRQAIVKIYRTHDHVYLSYSGGIDSMTLLSFIIDLGFIGQTTLVVFENQSQTHADCLHNDSERKRLVYDVCDRVKHMGAQIQHEIICMNDLLDSLHMGLAETKCYVTTALMKRHCNRAWIFGHHGNQILLHKDVFLDEILYRNPQSVNKVVQALSEPEFYTKNLQDYNVQKTLVPLHQRHLMLKPWEILQGINGCNIYAPIGSDNETFDWCRMIDFSTIDPRTITHAMVPRWLISQNNQDWLQDYITTESVADMDTLGAVELPTKDIDSNMLIIPENLKHHPEGIDWLQQELSTAQDSKKIAINTMVSLKNLHWLAQI